MKTLVEIQQFTLDTSDNQNENINEVSNSATTGGAYNPIFVTGTIQRADAKNKNGRVYPKGILEKAVDEYIKTKVNANNALGELDHPDSNSISLKNASHNIKKIWWEGADVKAKIELLDTPAGNILQALIRSGISIGISSRGMGSVKSVKMESENGTEYVDQIQEDFTLKCWDFVSDPSTHRAYMSVQENEQLSEDVKKQNYLNDKITESFTNILNSLS